jgi:hypothetical protein
MADAVHGSLALDPTVPDLARMYDFMLGGKDNYTSDREAVARLLAGFDLVEPGLVHVTDWRPTKPPRARFDPFLGAVGVRG